MAKKLLNALVNQKNTCMISSKRVIFSCNQLNNILCVLQRLPITRDLSPSKDSDKAAFWWTSIIEKPLKLF